MVESHSPLGWDTPHTEPPEAAWYDPRTIAWLLVVFVIITRCWFWHKLQSWRASRTNVTFDAVMALQRLEFIESNEDVPPKSRADARKAQRYIVKVCDEMNIDDERIDRYAGGDGDD